MKAVISSTGLWTPEESITNEELVESFNAYVDIWNSKNSSSIIDGKKLELTYSDAGFIEKASGVKSRYTISKKSILDPNIMAPRIPKRKNSEPSILAEIGFKAAQDALTKTNRNPKDIDAIICACSNLQRGYPAIAVEIQNLLGAQGFAFDMNVACSSATFGIETARCLISGGQAKTVLVINPEICTAHLNFKDRDSHFIFGDVATATLIDSDEVCEKEHWEIISSKLITEYSNNIRNNFGFLNHCAPEDDGMIGERGKRGLTDKLFVQNGRSVFKEVIPIVADMIIKECDKNNLQPDSLKRLWLHQANLSMNQLIAKKVLGKTYEKEKTPIVLDEYANTSSAGSIIAFHKYNSDFKNGDIGLICSFGAGYSAGAIFVKKNG